MIESHHYALVSISRLQNEKRNRKNDQKILKRWRWTLKNVTRKSVDLRIARKGSADQNCSETEIQLFHALPIYRKNCSVNFVTGCTEDN